MEVLAQRIIIAVIGLGAGLLGKIIFDWLKNARFTGVGQEEVDNRIESLREYLEAKLDTLLDSVNQLKLELARSYYTRNEGKSLEDKVDILESRIDRLKCPTNEEKMKAIEERLKSVEKYNNK